MSTRVVVSPAPSRGGVILRDRYTRAEIFVERDDLADVIAELTKEQDRPVRPVRRRA